MYGSVWPNEGTAVGENHPGDLAGPAALGIDRQDRVTDIGRVIPPGRGPLVGSQDCMPGAPWRKYC